MALQPSLPSANPSHERNFRQLSAGAGTGPGSGTSSALAQMDAAQLLPRGIHSLYAQNPGALLGSGQAAGMALGRGHAHNSLSSGFNSSTGPMTGGAARFLAGLNMNTVPSPSAFPKPSTLNLLLSLNPTQLVSSAVKQFMRALCIDAMGTDSAGIPLLSLCHF